MFGEHEDTKASTEAEEREPYVMGYGNTELEIMASRTADQDAQILLPHLRPGLTVLDCGCGPGTITLGLAEIVAPGQVTGVDVEVARVEEARRIAAERGVLNAHFDVASIYELPYQPGSFDAAFISGVLGNVSRPEDALFEVQRVLKPGGVVGVREFDHGGDLLFPNDGPLRESMEFYARLRASYGHDPETGRRLRGLLHGAGFVRISISASLLGTSSPEDVSGTGAAVANLFETEWGPRSVAAGWVDIDDVNRWVNAWRGFGERSDAFYAVAWVEAVGWKIGYE